MINFIPMVSLKPSKELKPKWISNKVKGYLQRKYLSYLRYNYTTDGVTSGKHYKEYGKHYEECGKHRNIANSEKIKSGKHYERSIADKCKADVTKKLKYVDT